MAVFDTQKIAFQLYGKEFRLSDLCWHLGIKAKRFHTSGNDAAYTLLALLRIASEISGPSSAGAAEVTALIAGILEEARSNRKRR